VSIIPSFNDLRMGLRHPRLALVWLFCPKEYRYVVVKKILDTEKLKQNGIPKTIVEKQMIIQTPINEHLVTLQLLATELNCKTIVELGTQLGESTIALLVAAKKIGGSVSSIDIDPCLQACSRVRSLGLENYWTFIQSDDLKVKWEKPIDLLFIDTSHTYDHTLNEMRKFEPHVRNGGVIIMHDIVTYVEVLHAINEYLFNRIDLRLYTYFNNNGLAVIFK